MSEHNVDYWYWQPAIATVSGKVVEEGAAIFAGGELFSLDESRETAGRFVEAANRRSNVPVREVAKLIRATRAAEAALNCAMRLGDVTHAAEALLFDGLHARRDEIGQSIHAAMLPPTPPDRAALEKELLDALAVAREAAASL